METNRYSDWLSLAILVSPAIVIALQLLLANRLPSNYSILEKLLYLPVYCLGRLLWRVEVVHREGLENLGKRGAIVVANHRNSLDPFFVQLGCGRRVHWMVAAEYFKNPIFGPALRILQAIPTNRSGSDSGATKTALRLAREGRLIGMFPEGKINRSQDPILPIRAGAALIAERENIPLVPCWIEGASLGWDVWSGLFIRSQVTVYLGDPIFIDENHVAVTSTNEQSNVENLSKLKSDETSTEETKPEPAKPEGSDDDRKDDDRKDDDRKDDDRKDDDRKDDDRKDDDRKETDRIAAREDWMLRAMQAAMELPSRFPNAGDRSKDLHRMPKVNRGFKIKLAGRRHRQPRT